MSVDQALIVKITSEVLAKIQSELVQPKLNIDKNCLEMYLFRPLGK